MYNGTRKVKCLVKAKISQKNIPVAIDSRKYI